MNGDILTVEQMDLFPQTRDFFENKTSKAIPIFIGCIIFLFVGFFTWASIAKMDDVIKAQAYIRPLDNISSVRILNGGKIIEKNYDANQNVKKGQLLLRLDDSVLKTEMSNTTLLLDHNKSEYNEYKELLKTIENKEVITPNLSQSIKYQSYYSEYTSLNNNILMKENEYKREVNAPSSLKVSSKIEKAKMDLLQAKLSFDTWKSEQYIKIKNNVSSLEQNIKSLETKLSSINQNLNNLNITAPISGIVEEVIPVNIGDIPLSSSEILRIIPLNNEKLKAEIIVDASKIPRIKVNQSVKLRFPGLPPSTFGQIESKIEEIPADMTVTNGKPIFCVKAVIDKPYLQSRNNERINLRPGILAEARIVISRDSVLKMILRKLDFIH